MLIGCKNDLRTDAALQLYLTVPGQESEESDSINRLQVSHIVSGELSTCGCGPHLTNVVPRFDDNVYDLNESDLTLLLSLK